MAVNRKKYSLVCYPESCDIIEALHYFKDLIVSYAYILHDRDFEANGEYKKPHYHVYVEFIKEVSSGTIENHFNTKLHQSVKSVEGVINYMTHSQYQDKAQYDAKEIIAHNINTIDICSRAKCLDNTEESVLIQIMIKIKTDYKGFQELLEWVLNQGYYYVFRTNYAILKDYARIK